jgi:transposase
MIRGEAWYMIREMLRDGVSVSEIARRTGVDRKTIRRIRGQGGHPIPRPRPPRPRLLDPYAAYLQHRVAAGVLNATKLCGELQRQGYPGGVAQVRRFVRPLRPVAPLVTERFETPAGHQGQVDWASCGRIWHDGQWRPLSAFVLTLGYSRRQYVEFTVRQDLETFLRCHVHAFRSFDGLPRELLYDNLKTAVDHRRADGSVVWNQRFRDFTDYYGFTPRACQPYRAQTKGKVERGIRYLKGHFLLGLDLAAITLDELNRAVRCWLRDTADVRRHGTTRERPIDRWAAEQAALRPLLGQPDYDTSYLSQRLVSRDAHLVYRGSRYPVPPEHAGRLVLVKEGEDGRIRVFAGSVCVSEHARAVPGTVVTVPGHTAAVRALNRRRPARPDSVLPATRAPLVWPVVETRPLAAYDIVIGLPPVGLGGG